MGSRHRTVQRKEGKRRFQETLIRGTKALDILSIEKIKTASLVFLNVKRQLPLTHNEVGFPKNRVHHIVMITRATCQLN